VKELDQSFTNATQNLNGTVANMSETTENLSETLEDWVQSSRTNGNGRSAGAR
jgi:hypothetical protein